MQDKTQGVSEDDVHAVYAPGRLFFLERTDPAPAGSGAPAASAGCGGGGGAAGVGQIELVIDPSPAGEEVGWDDCIPRLDEACAHTLLAQR